MLQNFNDYVKRTSKFAIYPKEHANEYLKLGLISEFGEVCGKLKKQIRGDEITQSDIDSEIGDVLWYLAQIIYHSEVTNIDIPNYYCVVYLEEVLDAMGEIEIQNTERIPTILSWLKNQSPIPLLYIAQDNIDKLEKRLTENKIKGSGDNR